MPRRPDAIAYVSSERPDPAVKRQRKDIGAWATQHGIRIASWHEDLDPVSGPLHKARPGLMAALVALRTSDATRLIVSSHARLGTGTDHAVIEQMVRRASAEIVAIDGAMAPHRVSRVVEALTLYDSVLSSVRIRETWEKRRARHERVGNIPYGYRLGVDGRTLVRDRGEQRVLTVVRQMKAQGLATRTIVEKLRALGAVGRTGKPISVVRVLQLIRRMQS